MIVVFSTRYGRLTMLGESASRLLRLAGHSGNVPGAVLAPDLPAFLARLRGSLEVHGEELSPPPPLVPATEDEQEGARDRPASVSLRKRAVPLVEMIETAIRRESDLMWEKA